jgi:glycosyltransferase involved in cell wall biosynthesis
MRLGGLRGVRLVGAVDDLAPWYRDAHAVIVPIRAGGGTRIKVLEAFRAGRAVVSTSIGMAGIEARHGEHVLIGDSAAQLAQHCARLAADPTIADGLAQQAFQLFLDVYSTEAVARSAAAMLDPRARRRS